MLAIGQTYKVMYSNSGTQRGKTVCWHGTQLLATKDFKGLPW